MVEMVEDSIMQVNVYKKLLYNFFVCFVVDQSSTQSLALWALQIENRDLSVANVIWSFKFRLEYNVLVIASFNILKLCNSS